MPLFPEPGRYLFGAERLGDVVGAGGDAVLDGVARGEEEDPRVGAAARVRACACGPPWVGGIRVEDRRIGAEVRGDRAGRVRGEGFVVLPECRAAPGRRVGTRL